MINAEASTKSLSRKCPSCNKTRTYNSKRAFDLASERNSKCPSCRTLGRKPTKENRLERKCPDCDAIIKYKSLITYKNGLKNDGKCSKCANWKSAVADDRDNKTKELEESGALQFSIKLNKWELTCPICKTVLRRTHKNNCCVCLKCNPPAALRGGTFYFTQTTEDAIVAYNQTEDLKVREQLYNAEIKYPFEKLVENVFNTFKFSYFESDPPDVMKETVGHLVANLNKFEAGKGKAFSYFSICAKNYLIALNNSVYKRRNQHVCLDDYTNDVVDESMVVNGHAAVSRQLQHEDGYYGQRDRNTFFEKMIEFWDNNVNNIFKKPRDRAIANAVVELFRSRDRLEIFNKKALYMLIREISGCDRTSRVSKIVNDMQRYYEQYMLTPWIKEGDFNTATRVGIIDNTPSVELTDEDVNAIQADTVSKHSELASRYGVSPQRIYQIRKRACVTSQ